MVTGLSTGTIDGDLCQMQVSRAGSSNYIRYINFEGCNFLSLLLAHTPPDLLNHGDVIKWKHFPRYWPLVWGIHRPPVNSPHKGQWRGALMFSLICNKLLSKQSWGWWFETPSRPLWRHCSDKLSQLSCSCFFNVVVHLLCSDIVSNYSFTCICTSGVSSH